jgi:hypothetical protein
MLPPQRPIDKRQVNRDGTLPFYLGMKFVFAMLLVFGSMAAQAAPQPPGASRPAPAPQRVPELRQALQQYHPGSAAAPLRLTAEQRAELRRQLSEYGPPPWATTVAAPAQRKDP